MFKRRRVKSDLQLRCCQTDRIDAINAAETLQILFDIARLDAQILIVRHTDDGNGCRRKSVCAGDLQNDRVGGGSRQFILFILDFTPQITDALVKQAFTDILEAHQDAGNRLAAVGGEELDILHLAHSILERIRDLFFDIQCGRPGQYRGDDDPVEIDGRILLSRQ